MLGQLSPKIITLIGKVWGIISIAPPSLIGIRGDFFRVLGIPEMVKKKKNPCSKVVQAGVSAVVDLE